MTFISRRSFLFFFGLASVVFGQSDSARYLWNSGGYQSGDKFFRSDVCDTMFLGTRQIMGIYDGDSSVVFPRKSIDAYDDSGGIKIETRSSTMYWHFPKCWEGGADSTAYVSLGIAPDEFQISMEGTSAYNKDINFYSRRAINLGLKMPGDQSGDYMVQFREQFNCGLPSMFERFPFRLHGDRCGYGYGLTKFLELNPNYANMGYYCDSVIILNIQFDTLFGAYGAPGSGYGKFVRGQVLDTVKFDIDRTGAYTIHNGTEIRLKAIQTESLYVKYIVAQGDRFADMVYIDRPSAFRVAYYVPGITAEYGCLLTLQGDDDEFIILKGLCKTDSLVIRGSGGYAGYIEYLLCKKAYQKIWPGPEEYKAIGRRRFFNLEVLPSITTGTTKLRYTVPEHRHIKLALYDVAGREAALIVDGAVEAGQYSFDLDLSRFSQGLYFLKLEVDAEIINEKVVVVR
ncbi:MAG TPA: T9SS type A sorting domain-containing protein [bacterium]